MVVQAPALEALKAAPEPAAPPAASAPAAGPAAPQRSAQAPPPVPDIPEPRKPAEAARGHGDGGHPQSARPGAKAERELMRELPVRPADVCALGRRHGHWHPDSPEARICAGVHGG